MFGIKTRLRRLFAAARYRLEFAPAGGRPLGRLPLQRKFRLDIPTYEGSGQVVHPDIFFDRPLGKYVLAFTPYPHTNDRYENPCVALSDDGIRFYEERPGLNPLAPAPAKDHNDDPDISLHDGEYSLLYLETVRPDYQSVVLLASRDRLDWKRSVLYRQNLGGRPGAGLILSPAVIWAEGRCRCFFVLGDYAHGHSVRCAQAESLGRLDFAAALAAEASVQVDGIPPGLQPWHLDVFADGAGGYLMLLTLVAPKGRGGAYSLHIARSRDLARWQLDAAPVLRNCYRASGFVRDGILCIYFSSNFAADEWRTGLYKVRLGE